MPEGPEIKRAADALAAQVAGKRIDRIFFGLDSLTHWQQRLAGVKIVKVKTYGKAMVICLDNKLNIYSHNQLYGRWYFCDTGKYPDTNRQLRLAIECQDKSALLYSASTIAVLTDQALAQHPFIAKLGPDVLAEHTTVDDIVERLNSKRFRRRQLASILTDQSFVAGLGNYLRCEILFYCGLHPKVCSRELSDEKLCFLAEAVLALSRQSYHTAGITNDLKQARRLMKQGVSFENARFYVYRRAGEPCYRCGHPIEKNSIAGQALYYCPECQCCG